MVHLWVTEAGVPKNLVLTSAVSFAPRATGLHESVTLLQRILELCSQMDTLTSPFFFSSSHLLKTKSHWKMQNGLLVDLRGGGVWRWHLSKTKMSTTQPEITRGFTTKGETRPFPISKERELFVLISHKYLVQRYGMQHNFVHFKFLKTSLLTMWSTQIPGYHVLSGSQPSWSVLIEDLAKQIDLWVGACYLLIFAWFSWVVITAVTPDTLSMGNEDSG